MFAASENRTVVIDLIYDLIDHLMLTNRCDLIDALLDQQKVTQDNIGICIALLSSSLPVKETLLFHKLLYMRTAMTLKVMGENPDEELKGLR
jgi:hypothetical protein